MIRPLRRRHRFIVPVLFAALIVAGVLAATYRAPAKQTDTLPAALLLKR
jgi:hypothetical protein